MYSNKISGWLPVLAALIGNIVVTVIKFIAAIISSSSALFSEAIHSFADTSNQVLLFIGIQRSRKLPDSEFIYGYGQERFFWALLSACCIFFVGAGITVFKGVDALIHPQLINFEPIIFAILIASFVIESCTFMLAVGELKGKYPEWQWQKRLQDGDPSTLAVLLEDGIAVVGVIIAAISIMLSKYTGQHIWDALGSIIIGVLLGTMAIILIIKNRTYLIGKQISPDLQEKIIAKLESEPAIEKVLDFKSNTLDIGIYRIKCEIEFNGMVLLKEIMKNNSLEDEYEEIKHDYEEFKRFCFDYADRIPRLVGRKIDEIEQEDRKSVV
jgi:solute carrier family 30 (zinc transporter), member 9